MAMRSGSDDFEMATRIMRPILADVKGEVVEGYAPLMKASNITDVFRVAGINAYHDYLYKIIQYGESLLTVDAPVADALFVLTGKVAGAHAQVMQMFPHAKRDGLNLTQTFHRHRTAVGLFVNYIHQSQTNAQLRGNRLVQVGLEAQKAIFIPAHLI